MPRPTKPAAAVAALPERVFSPVADGAQPGAGSPFALHVGDTWLEPFEGGRMQDLDVETHPGMHRYCETAGIPELRDAIVEKVRERNGLACERESVRVAAGATGALACTVGAIADPGEEVLILAPFWPLIRGIVQALRAQPVEVPFYDRVESAEDAVLAVEERLSSRSVALYVSTPSNPTGRVLPASWLAALAELARRHDLWLLSDEVYEDTVYRGEHVSLGRFAPERTVSVYSFSKAYGMAGNRVGYLVAPPPLASQAEKVGVHTFYHAPTAGQLAAFRALENGRGWLEAAREAYRAAGEQTARVLGVAPPEGSTVLFVDVASRLDERGVQGLLEDCARQGVLVAPGSSSGTGYESWIRLCYTSLPPEQTAEAARRLARHLGSEGIS
jgi:N-succinyldiaminopimelate aminotransferase